MSLSSTPATPVDENLLDESAEELYDHAPCGYVSTSPDGLILKVNQTLLDWLGYDRADLVGKQRFCSLLTSGGKIFYETHFSPLLRMQGTVNGIALDLMCRSGDRRPVLVCAVQRSNDQGKPLLNRITLFDSLERRRYETELLHERRRAEQVARELARKNEELRRANADLEQFAYSASHDLKEPLRAIAIYSELLEKRYGPKLDPEGVEYLGFTVQGARRMQALLEDLLAYTQSAHLSSESNTPIDSDRILNQALWVLKREIQESGAVINSASLPQLRVHEVHLLQLLQNLISNALKYRGEQAPVVKITASREGAFCRIAVQDNGIGIEPQYADQIFGLFKRLHSSAQYPGTGIGLAICRKIVDSYGGRIWVESEGIGRGSTFFFTLPGS